MLPPPRSPCGLRLRGAGPTSLARPFPSHLGLSTRRPATIRGPPRSISVLSMNWEHPSRMNANDNGLLCTGLLTVDGWLDSPPARRKPFEFGPIAPSVWVHTNPPPGLWQGVVNNFPGGKSRKATRGRAAGRGGRSRVRPSQRDGLTWCSCELSLGLCCA